MDEDAYTGYARTLGRTVDEFTGEQSAPEGWGALLLDEAQFVKTPAPAPGPSPVQCRPHQDRDDRHAH